MNNSSKRLRNLQVIKRIVKTSYSLSFKYVIHRLVYIKSRRVRLLMVNDRFRTLVHMAQIYLRICTFNWNAS